jgi:5-methylcytosine-specific restriction endonuclease McrA
MIFGLLAYAAGRWRERKKHRVIPGWTALQAEHLRGEPACRACGGEKKLQVHHVEPYHLHPELATDPQNLITLCERLGRRCHFLIGHGGDWKARNPNVVSTASFAFLNPKLRRTALRMARLGRLYE